MDSRKTVTTLKLSASRAEKIVQERAQDADNIIFGDHAMERMEERGIYDHDVLRILRGGWVDNTPELTDDGEWKCKMTLELKRGRSAGVITIILHGGMLFVKTVEWEDVK